MVPMLLNISVFALQSTVSVYLSAASHMNTTYLKQQKLYKTTELLQLFAPPLL